MKLATTTILLFALAAIGNAARFPSFNPLGPLEKYKQYTSNLGCVCNVVSNIMENSNMKSNQKWRDLMGQFDQIISVDLKNCMNMEDGPDKEKCKNDCVKKATGPLKDFSIMLVKKMRFDLIKKIHNDVEKTCGTDARSSDEPKFLDIGSAEYEAEEEEESNGSYSDQFQCIVNVLGNVSVNNGLEDLWSAHQPNIQGKLYEWKNCAGVNNRFMRAYCKTKGAISTYRQISEYVQLAARENGQFLHEFAENYQRNCGANSVFDIFLGEVMYWNPTSQSPEVPTFFDIDSDYTNETPKLVEQVIASSFVEQFECLVDTLGRVSEQNGLEDLWLMSLPNIQKRINQWKLCATETNNYKRFVCNVSQGANTYKMIASYVKEVSDPAIIKQFMSKYAEKCEGSGPAQAFAQQVFEMNSF